MKAKILVAIATCVLATNSFAQSEKLGVSPVYIPNSDLEISNKVKPASAVEPLKTSSISGGCDSCSDSCGCDSGCSVGGGGCDGGCSNPNYWGKGKTCGCGDNVGRSFFGRLRDASPIKFNISRGGVGDCGCDEADCGCESPTGLARFLPISFKLRTNHCCRYFGVFGGWFDLQAYRGQVMGNDRLIDFNDGWQLGIKRGRVFANGIRLENELTYRHNTNDTYQQGNFVGPDFIPTATFDAIGSIYALQSMSNVLYDFQNFGRVTPYVGIGLGGIYADGDINVTALGSNDSISDTAFAYQFIAGLSRQLTERSTAFVEYKYFGTSGLEVEQAGVAVGEFDYQNDNVIFGLRWTIPNRCCSN